ncbi:hypothetical protein IW262DRAFT_1517244 [Armillaria fumosa]|nr:hypothetical protein IW262DRAFT_1517244 [Armillaria fumosa]
MDRDLSSIHDWFLLDSRGVSDVMTSSIMAGDSRGNHDIRRSNGLWLIYLKGILTNAVELAMPLPFGGASKDPTIQSTMAVNVYLVDRTMRSIKIRCEDSCCLGKKHGPTFVQGVRLCMAWISPAGWRPGALEACRPLLLLMFNSGANEPTRNLGPESLGSAELPSSFFPSAPCVQCFPKPAGSSSNLLTEVPAQNYHGDLVLNYQLCSLVPPGQGNVLRKSSAIELQFSPVLQDKLIFRELSGLD